MSDTNTEQQSSNARPGGAMRIPALIISYLFHPLFIPLMLAIIVYLLYPISFAAIDRQQMVRLWAAIAINTLLFPLITVLLLKGLGFLKSLHMHHAKERTIPLMATMIFYFWIYLVMKGKGLPLVYTVLFLGNFLNIVVLFMLNIFVKPSMHTTAAGGIIGMMIIVMIMNPVNMILPLVISIVLAGIIGSARLALKAHTPAEIYLGYIMGALVQLAAFLYLR